MRTVLRCCALLLGLGCMIASGVLFLENTRDETVAQTTSQTVVQAFGESVEKQMDKPSPTQEMVLEKPEESTVEIDGEIYLGILSIPQLELDLPIAKTCTDQKLEHTPCAYAGSLLENTLIIAGHNYKAHFGKIHQLELGDMVTILDATGVERTYALIGDEIISENDSSALYAGEWNLTLFTCLYENNTKRVVLRFQLED